MRILAVAALAGFAAGCGYVGDPLPPSLHIPTPVRDLRVIEYGDTLSVDFTVSAVTTDNVPMTGFGPAELHVSDGGHPFDMGGWAASGKDIALDIDKPGVIHTEIPAREWLGKEIVVGLRLTNVKGRKSEWSNLVPISIVQPVAGPADVKAQATADGVFLTWSGNEPEYRVFRRAPDDAVPGLLGEAKTTQYLDRTAQFGRSYEYLVQAVREKAESALSPPVSITPQDVFPPAVPAGLTAITGIGAIELAWDRNTEPDLKGYRVYRALEGGPWDRIADVDVPTYSDHQIQSGKRYRYAVTSIDQIGNESAKSAAVQAAAP